MDVLITLAAYILGFFAVMLTIGLVAWLFIARFIWSECKKSKAEFDEISERIEKNRGSFDRPNRHKIDL